VALPHFKKWAFPEDLEALATYMALCKEQEAFKNTDYGPETILAGWRSHGLLDP
jgi:hypothetical protein